MAMRNNPATNAKEQCKGINGYAHLTDSSSNLPDPKSLRAATNGDVMGTQQHKATTVSASRRKRNTPGKGCVFATKAVEPQAIALPSLRMQHNNKAKAVRTTASGLPGSGQRTARH